MMIVMAIYDKQLQLEETARANTDAVIDFLNSLGITGERRINLLLEESRRYGKNNFSRL